MLAKVKYPYRRRNQRLNVTLEILLPNQVKGRTKNVSANGVSFEVIADDINAFRPGTIISLEIATTNITHESKLNNLRLSAKGLIISREVVEETTASGSRLNIAVQLKNKLDFWVPSIN
ncbi:MAG: PilZ domain-containing protein [Candidatus Scalindua sp.]